MRSRKSHLIYNEPVIQFVSDRVPGGERGLRGRAIGFVSEETITAGVVFHEWFPETGVVEITVAARKGSPWLTATALRVLGDYAFKFAQMVVAKTSARQVKARSIWRKLGGDEHVIPRLWGEDESGVLLTLTREQWHGRTKSPSSA